MGPERSATLTPSELNGRWESQGCEPFPQADGSTLYLQRRFEFDAPEWRLQARTFADAQCTAALLVVTVGGEFMVETPSTAVPGAHHVRFSHAELSVQARSEQVLPVLEAARCGSVPWQQSVSQDVSTSGCLFLPSVTECPAEYDLVKVDGQRLYFGRRASDLCSPERRPMALETTPVFRAEAK